MTPLPERLPQPHNIHSDKWVDEAIWGHRLYDEQTPWMTLLEFLNIFQHENLHGRALKEEHGFNTLEYQAPQRWELRHVLFNNPKLTAIMQHTTDNEARWAEWLHEMHGIAEIRQPGLGYLRQRFSQFADFAEIVNQLRATSLEVESNKRWTSHFVFPFGPDCLYEDLNAQGENDRRFFARTGELLYLMLCRTKPAFREALASAIPQQILRVDSTWNRIVGCLQPVAEIPSSKKRNDAYLPYATLSAYDCLAEDWLNLIRLGLPEHDVLPHIVNLTGLHLLSYLLNIGRAVAGMYGAAVFVCELVAPRKTLVRQLSCDTYQENNGLSIRAVEAYLQQFRASTTWQAAVRNEAAFEKCRELLKQRFRWGDDYDGAHDPDALFAALLDESKSRHRQHMANIHRVYGREIGLISKRGTNRLRYAPTDDLLKSLLFACVEKRMELNQFLAHLYKRYGLVFGDREASVAMPGGQAEKKPFEANARRLEQRLASLGLLRRLSDGCAYVVNPYRQGGET